MVTVAIKTRHLDNPVPRAEPGPHRRLAYAAGAGLLLLAGTAQAVWSVDPTVTVRSGYDDNMRLSALDPEKGTTTTAQAQARVRYLTERSQVAGYVGLNYRWYSGVDNLEDKDSEFLRFIADRRFERSMVSVQGSYTRDDLLRSLRYVPTGVDDVDAAQQEQIDELDQINDAADVDSGDREQIRRERYNITPAWSYRFTERSSGSIGYTFAEQKYDDDDLPVGGGNPNGVQDSRTQALTLTLHHRLSEVDTLVGSIRRARYEPELTIESDTYEVQVGWSRRLSEITSVNFDIGARRVETDFDEETGMLYRASIQRRADRGRLIASAERSLYPSSFGQVVETDRLALRYRHSLAERWTMNVAMRAFSTNSAAGANNNRNRDFLQAGVGVDYTLTEHIKVGLDYGYRWIDKESDAGSADANSVNLSFSWSPGPVN